MADRHSMSSGAWHTLSKLSWSPPSKLLFGRFSLIQSDQKQHTFGVVEEGGEAVLGVVVVMVVVVLIVVVVTGLVDGVG